LTSSSERISRPIITKLTNLQNIEVFQSEREITASIYDLINNYKTDHKMRPQEALNISRIINVSFRKVGCVTPLLCQIKGELF
jgi:hypothetical protein